MRATEILEELPKLSAEERALIRRRLNELEDAESALFLHEAADQLFQRMDAEEADDARRKAR